jgi:hypothetical protein
MHDCATMIAATPGVPVADFQSFAASCAEMQAGSSLLLPASQVLQFRILVNTEGTAQASTMFPGGQNGAGGAGHGDPLDPLQPLTPVPPPPPGDAVEGGDETAVQQYHAVCTSADVASCMPTCNTGHHGYELLATIDGTDTKFGCNLAHGLYSWMGAASEGGYLGSDAQSFLSAVVSGAAGAYIVTLMADAGIGTDLMIQPGQNVHISGDPGLAAAPSVGSGGFTVEGHAILAMTRISFGGIYTSRIIVESEGRAIITSCAIIQDLTQGVLNHVIVKGGGYLSLSSMTLHAVTLHRIVDQATRNICEPLCAGHGPSVLNLVNVVVPEVSSARRTGTITIHEDGNPDVRTGGFVVDSGPCEALSGGRCVGRPDGYGDGEACTIRVPSGALLGACPTWDTTDIVFPVEATLDGSSYQYSGDCPNGVTVPEGETITWRSDRRNQHWVMCDVLPVQL